MLQYPLAVDSAPLQAIINQILFLAKVLTNVPISESRVQAIFHKQFLKSSLFSARIEGNKLTLADVQSSRLTDGSKNRREIDNCIKALRLIYKHDGIISLKLVKQIHEIVLSGLSTAAGKLRTEQSAIFDGSGTAVYVTPDLITMTRMLDDWSKEVGGKSDVVSALLNLARAHYYFEKIHPFIDGNGRTGRVLLQSQMRKIGIFGEFILPIDEYFEINKAEYYHFLENSSRNVQEYTDYLLTGVVWSLEQVLNDIKSFSEQESRVSLLPRRQEILAIIQDHPLISQETISRRFPTVALRTIGNDLTWLVVNQYVIKHGSTRGVRYSAKEM